MFWPPQKGGFLVVLKEGDEILSTVEAIGYESEAERPEIAVKYEEGRLHPFEIKLHYINGGQMPTMPEDGLRTRTLPAGAHEVLSMRWDPGRWQVDRPILFFGDQSTETTRSRYEQAGWGVLEVGIENRAYVIPYIDIDIYNEIRQ